MRTNVFLTSIKCGILAILALSFLSGISITISYIAFKCIPHVKYKEKSIDNASFFVLFTVLDLIWPKFCRRDHTRFAIFCLFPINYIRGLH